MTLNTVTYRNADGTPNTVTASVYEQCVGCWVATTNDYDGPGSPIGISTVSAEDALRDLSYVLSDRCA